MALRHYRSRAEAECLVLIIGGNPANGWSGEDPTWNPQQPNRAGSGAYGLPQALPGSKMASAGPDWASDPVTQLRWMMGYIDGPRYGTPCVALDHEYAHDWY
jgi:hypothetical protein